MIVASIQARMGSSRLPGKVLKEIQGKPILLHIHDRLKKSKYIDQIYVATTISKNDNAIAEFGRQNGIKVVRGSIENYVDRHLIVVDKTGADTLIRIWGDCPFIDPNIVDQGIKKFFDLDADFGSNRHPRTYPVGMDFEIYKVDVLKKIMSQDESYYHKYPFEYVMDNKDVFKIVNLESRNKNSELYLVVDYPEDFKFVGKLFGLLGTDFRLKDVFRVLNDDPDLLKGIKGLKRRQEFDRAKSKFKG